MYDLIVIGGGPAGLTAMAYATRRGRKALLVSQDLGGKIIYELELPGLDTSSVLHGVELVEQLWRELDEGDFARQLELVQAVTQQGAGFAVHTAAGETLTARAVIVATGARFRQMQVPGENEFFGRGLSYSALSYAPLFVNKQVAVVGSGKLAERAVAELAGVAAVVHLVIPPTSDTETVSIDVEQAAQWATAELVVYRDYRVTAVTGREYAEQLHLQSPDGDAITLKTDGIFVALGLLPNSALVQELVTLDAYGRIPIDHLNRTTCPGLFAAGDVTNTYAEQVLIAVGEGAKAALSAYAYLLRLGDS